MIHMLMHVRLRAKMRKEGEVMMHDHLLGKVHRHVIEAAIDTHLASTQPEVRWLGEGMQRAYEKWKKR